MERMGLDKPLIEGQAHGVGRESDLGGEAVYRPEVAIVKDRDADAAALEAIRQCVAVLISGCNLKVEIPGLAFAAGLSACSTWGSQSNAAKALGVSRQHLVKSTKRWQRLLNLPSNPYTSSKAKSVKLRNAQLTGHWRKRKFKESENSPCVSK